MILALHLWEELESPYMMNCGNQECHDTPLLGVDSGGRPESEGLEEGQSWV